MGLNPENFGFGLCRRDSEGEELEEMLMREEAERELALNPSKSEIFKGLNKQIESACKALEYIKDKEEYGQSAGDLLKKIEAIKNKIETGSHENLEMIVESEIANHMEHIVGQAGTGLGFAQRLIKVEKYEPSEENLLKVQQCKFEVGQAMNVLGDYFDLLLSNEEFFKRELYSRGGFFEKQRLPGDTDKLVEDLEAKDFVAFSRETLKGVKTDIAEAEK